MPGFLSKLGDCQTAFVSVQMNVLNFGTGPLSRQYALLVYDGPGLFSLSSKSLLQQLQGPFS